MSLNTNSHTSNNAPLPPEPQSNHGENSGGGLPRNIGWLRGFRIDDIRGPKISPHQIATCVEGKNPSIEEENLSTEIIATTSLRQANCAHHGWSIDAITTVCPWAASRVAARNQHNPEGTWYTRLIKTKGLKIEVFLEDLTPVPLFEAAVEEALNQPTLFDKFQAIYRVLDRCWSNTARGDVVPLEIEVGSSIALTGDRVICVQPPELSEHNGRNVAARLSSLAHATAVTIIGTNANMTFDQWAAQSRTEHWERIAVNRVVPTIALLSSRLQARLSALYAQRLSYVPLDGIGAIDHRHRTYDDNQHASRTISSIKIRSSNYIELLSITYSDGTTSSKHGGNGHVGIEYEFKLAAGEHISEMLIWVEGDWLVGLQFITTTGRCSPQYGVHFGVPTVARCKGGILVGFLSHTRLHPSHKEMFGGVQGIWRRDLISRVPKDDDVHSEYFGDKNQNGTVFNDRVLVGNSTSISISSVDIWSGECIDGIQFTYTDTIDGCEHKSSTTRRGGPGGPCHRFTLEDGEHIVTISGRHEVSRITQLCFGTNRGRTSEVFGGGRGQTFSSLAPRDSDGNYFRLHYICGKSNEASITGIMFVWTPC
ncbi:unnamed protein product [Rhizoctonia solani]|uniref:Jacalin-type lectin domain-containing protein n=1 Tax=Rhizoctonia solani TaxID=456999 RepID=A0A8H3E3C9_9AGAM|nr:unnamed protein product [Rhizoctonia solani]